MKTHGKGEVVFLLICLAVIIISIAWWWRFPAMDGNPDTFTEKVCSNISNGGCWYEVRSHQANEYARKAFAEKQRLAKEARECYDAGFDWNVSFDLVKDYNLTCPRINYLNDHLLINYEQKGAGYIKGHYSGLLSSGYIESKLYQWVGEQVLATGELVEFASFHNDCNNITTTKEIDFFTKEEFVNHFVFECIE